MVLLKQIRILQIFNVKDIKSVLESSKDVLHNISGNLDLRSNIEVEPDEQKELEKMATHIMKEFNQVCKIVQFY